MGLDFGNMSDDDGCVAGCKIATCGDFFTQQGVEQCDDGNQIDTDACVSCQNAFCPDGIVWAGIEACDDGDFDNTDACTTLCAPPACDDTIKSGAETDIDCGGGTCAKCVGGQACLINGDCLTGNCTNMVCAPPQSCKQIHDGNPALGDGMYQIDPDGVGGFPPIDAWCDMTVDGGGWTVFYSVSGADGEQPLVSNTEVLANNPLLCKDPNPALCKPYNTSRLKKAGLSAISTETIFVRPGETWLKVDKAAFTAALVQQPMTTYKTPVNLVANDGTAAAGYMGWANYGYNIGGDFGITENIPDGTLTCPPNMVKMTTMGFDHQSNSARMLNCTCSFSYLFSYSVTNDSDAGYDVKVGLGSWAKSPANISADCQSAAAEGGALKFYAAMR